MLTSFVILLKITLLRLLCHDLSLGDLAKGTSVQLLIVILNLTDDTVHKAVNLIFVPLV